MIREELQMLNRAGVQEPDKFSILRFDHPRRKISGVSRSLLAKQLLHHIRLALANRGKHTAFGRVHNRKSEGDSVGWRLGRVRDVDNSSASVTRLRLRQQRMTREQG